MKNFCTIKTSVANLYKKPSFTSELVTQAILKEKLTILEKSGNWYKIEQWDKYQSWIHEFYIDSFDLKSNISWTELPVTKKTVNDLIIFAKSFLGTPYLWGGKSSLGFDCSGLVQTVFKMCGINMPRDASQQILRKNLFEIDFKNINIGDLLFFKEQKTINHVAIYIGNNQIIHSSGSVKIEKLDVNKQLYEKLFKTMSIEGLFNE